MRKSTRILKRLAALSLVLLLSIESFAAVVGDNDGAAFITKAEFDSLKSDFQKQIDRYNNSLDNKIDGAIASYLSGVKVGKATNYAVEVSDWKEVTLLNHTLEQTWKWPNLSIAFAYGSSKMNSSQWYETWWAEAGVVYKRGDNDYQKRNCVDAGTESTTNTAPDNVVWLGRAENYVDSLSANQIGALNAYLSGATYAGSALLVVDALLFGGGYLPSQSISSKYAGGCAYWNAQNTPPSIGRYINASETGTWMNTSVESNIALGVVNDKQYLYQHIVNFDNYSWTSLSDPNWTNTLNDNPSFTQNQVLTSSSVEKNGAFRIFEIWDTHYPNDATQADWESGRHEYSDTATMRYQIPGGSFKSFNSGHGHNTASSAKMKSVGVLNKTYSSEDIYQWSGKRKLKRDDTVEIEKINLYNGALIAYAKSEESFKWEPVIIGSYNNGTTDVDIKKWRVKLSNKPFGVNDTLGTGAVALINDGETHDYLVTDDDGKCKFEFKIEDDTVIWCKWWPDDTTICDNYDWEGTLDLTKCGTYTITA